MQDDIDTMALMLLRNGACFERAVKELCPINGWRQISGSSERVITLPDGMMFKYLDGEYENAIRDAYQYMRQADGR